MEHTGPLEAGPKETATAVDGARRLFGGDVRVDGTDGGRPPQRSGGPFLHPDLIRRGALLEWFSAHRTERVVAIFAPAGYGKTTLLGQAAEADPRPFAWVSVEDRDNDPVVLMTQVAHGLERIVKVGPAVFEALRFPVSALWSTTVPRLGAAVASIERAAVVVVDDVDLLCDRDCLDIVAAILAYLPEGSQLVLGGRQEPQLGLARLRAERGLAELGREELAFGAVEAGALLHAAGVELPESEVADLTRKTEGWAVGLYLTSLSLREGGSLDRDAGSSIGGQSGPIADYLRSEVLSRMTSEHVSFLTRTAVLERMCGPLCDVVLEQTGSAAMLESLERSNRLVVPLDGRGEWYRYHHRAIVKMGPPSQCSRLEECPASRRGPGSTTRVRTRRCVRGSPPTPPAWTTSTGFAGLTGSVARCVAARRRGGCRTVAGRVAAAGVVPRRRRGRSFTAREHR